MEKIFEENNFLCVDDCKKLINYQKSNSTYDMFDKSWNSRTVCVYDEEIKKMTNNIHNRIINHCIKFYKEKIVYLEYSSLVYWGQGMSMNPHADNFWIDYPKRPHPGSYRDYSSVLYLNDDFEGGETYFLKDNYYVKPKTGKLIIFTSGDKHIHGVKEILKGERYTMATWYTKFKKKILIYS